MYKYIFLIPCAENKRFFAQPGDYEIFAACPPFFTYIPNPNHEREKNCVNICQKKFDLLEHASSPSLSKFFFQIYNMNCTIYFAQKQFFNPTHWKPSDLIMEDTFFFSKKKSTIIFFWPNFIFGSNISRTKVKLKKSLTYKIKNRASKQFSLKVPWYNFFLSWPWKIF